MKIEQVQNGLNPASGDGRGAVNLWNLGKITDVILCLQSLRSTNNVQDISWVVYVRRK
jgi:hypothetical protein